MKMDTVLPNCCVVLGMLLLFASLRSPAALAQATGSDATAPVLTLGDAIAAATAHNRQVQLSGLDVRKSIESVAQSKSARYPQFNVYVNAGLLLTPVTFTIKEGQLGSYPATGPIPGSNALITTPRQFNAFILGSASQPLAQLYKINLSVEEARVGVQLAKEAERQQQMQTVDQVKDAYYALVQTQSQLESAEATLKYLSQLAVETKRNFTQQTALKSDVLNVQSKISQQQYQILTLQDTLENQREALNRLLGRELTTEFLVEATPAPDQEEFDLAYARRTALQQRPELRQAELQVKKAQLDVRLERAQYIPDLSLDLHYFSAPNIYFLPSNAANVGLTFQWQPFDWGKKAHIVKQLKAASQQAHVSEDDEKQQVLIDVGTAFRKLKEARASLSVQAASVETEREKLRVLVNQYGQKAALLSDVLSEESSLKQAEAAQAQALATFWTSKADFERALGEQ